MVNNVIGDVLAIDKAATLLEAAKNTERLANEARIRAEEALLKLVAVKEVGSATTRVPGWKIETKGNVNISIDKPALEAVRGTMPPAIYDQAIRYEPDVIAAGLKYLKDNEPAHYLTLCSALSKKPGKTGVSIERIAIAQEQAA